MLSNGYIDTGTLNIHGSISISAGQLKRFKVVFYFFAIASTFWIVAVGAILFSVQALVDGRSRVTTIANGSVYMGLLATAIVLNMAIIFPGVIILQPIRLWRVARAERNAITPRQRFRGQSGFFYYLTNPPTLHALSVIPTSV